MFAVNLLQVKRCGTEDTEMNRTGSHPEGVHTPPRNRNKSTDIGEERDTSHGKEEDGESRKGYLPVDNAGTTS